MVIRRGGRQDVRFLRDMLHHAYYWRERNPADGPGPAPRHIKGWGGPGGRVPVAVRGGVRVGGVPVATSRAGGGGATRFSSRSTTGSRSARPGTDSSARNSRGTDSSTRRLPSSPSLSSRAGGRGGWG